MFRLIEAPFGKKLKLESQLITIVKRCGGFSARNWKPPGYNVITIFNLLQVFEMFCC